MHEGPIIVQRDDVDRIPSAGADLPPWYSAPPRRLDWRAMAVLCAFGAGLLLVLGLAVWPILFDSYATGPRRFVQLMAAVLVAGLVLAAVLGAIGLALRPWLVRQPGGLAMTVLQSAGLDAQALLVQQLEAQRAYAARNMPHVGALTVTYPKPETGPALAPALAAPPDPAEPELALVAPEVWLDWLDERPHVILAAETKAGKSTTAKALLAGRIARGEALFIIDPHSSAWFDLPSVGGGENWPIVRRAFRAVYDLYLDRLEERDRYRRETGRELPHDYFPRLTVLLDEANNTHLALDKARRGELSDWQEFARVLGSGARKVGISIVMLCQSANVKELNLDGGMVRNFTRIALDHATARQMIKHEETSPARRAALYELLAGQEYPAVVALRGQVHALDRAGLDRYPAPADAAGCAWAGWDYAADEPAELAAGPGPSVSVSVNNPHDLLENMLFRTVRTVRTENGLSHQDDSNGPDGHADGHADGPGATDGDQIGVLMRLRRRGISREAARNEHGLAFENWQWAEAGRRLEAMERAHGV